MRAATASATALVLAGAVTAQNSTSCDDGLHMIVARGTNEDAGTGSAGPLAERVARRINSSDVEALDYPATFTDPSYIDSVLDGAEELRDTILDYHKACPDSKLAVVGYSQGAHVASEVFCGSDGGDDKFGQDDPLSKSIAKGSLVAIVLLGDPSHTANATYDKGTSHHDGIFARDSVSACEALGDRIVSYCDHGDIYCDSGENRTVHGLYVENYGDEIVDFIVKRYDEHGGDGPSSSGTATTAAPTASGTASPSATEEGGAATETGDAGGEASGLVPALGLVFLGSLAVLGLM